MRHPYRGLTPNQIGTAWVCVRFYPLTRPEGDTRPCGPTIHENNGHSLLGDVDVVVNKAGRLDLLLDDLPAGSAIGFPSYTCDEALARRGVALGPSGGNSLTDIEVSIGAPSEPYGRKVLDLRIAAHYSKLVYGETANVWLKLEHDLSAVVPPCCCTPTP